MSTLTLQRKKHRIPRDSYYPGDSAHADRGADAASQTNLLWLCEEMERLSDDVIDREICRRLRQFAGQIEYDLPVEVVLQIRAGRRQAEADVDITLIPEALVPFYRHYAFMKKRELRENS